MQGYVLGGLLGGEGEGGLEGDVGQLQAGQVKVDVGE